jgi:hypothetical protein
MPVSQSISVPYTSKVTKVTFFGIGMRRALCRAAAAERGEPRGGWTHWSAGADLR